MMNSDDIGYNKTRNDVLITGCKNIYYIYIIIQGSHFI